MTEVSKRTIDIEAVLRSKMGDKAWLVPRPLVNWLKRIAHEDELNDFLWTSRDLKGTPWLEATVSRLKMHLDVTGLENLPPKDNGRFYTFVSNHPLGGIDGVALGSIIGRHYDDRFRYLVNDLLMNLPGLAPLCVPINKTGKKGRDFPQLVRSTFQSQNHVLMFPAGLCSRQQDDGSIRDIPWTKTFITKSVETQRDVVPIHFSGANSKKFYRLARFSDRYLPFNLAMLFLADEMFKNEDKHFNITIGKPIAWQTFDKTRKHTEWAAWVEDQVYRLAP